MTDIDFEYDDVNKKAYINFIHEISSYSDGSTAIGLIEIVNVSKIGSLSKLVKVQIDGGAPITGTYLFYYSN